MVFVHVKSSDWIQLLLLLFLLFPLLFLFLFPLFLFFFFKFFQVSSPHEQDTCPSTEVHTLYLSLYSYYANQACNLLWHWMLIECWALSAMIILSDYVEVWRLRFDHKIPEDQRRGMATSNKNRLRHSRRTEPHRKSQEACQFEIYWLEGLARKTIKYRVSIITAITAIVSGMEAHCDHAAMDADAMQVDNEVDAPNVDSTRLIAKWCPMQRHSQFVKGR